MDIKIGDRSVMFDWLRGFAILAIAIEHVFISTMPNQAFFGVGLYNITASFDIALAVTIAGYFAYQSLNRHQGSIFGWIKGKAYYLLIPHILFNVIVYHFSYTGLPVWGNISETYTYPQWLVGSLFMDLGEWFLWILFAIFVFIAEIHYLSKRLSRNSWLMLVGATIILSVIPLQKVALLDMYRIEFYLPFALMGYLGAKYKDAILRNFKVKHLIILSVISLTCYISMMSMTGWRTVRAFTSTDFSTTYIRYLQALTALPVIFLIGYASSKLRFISRPIVFVGSNAIWIYLCTLGFTRMGFGQGQILVISSIVGAIAFAVIVRILAKRFIVNKITRTYVTT